MIFSGDLRGQVERMPYFATVFRQQRRALPEALALDTGGWASGSALADRFQGAPMIDVMNELGYHAAAVGPADLTFGLKPLLKRAEQARFPLLAANLVGADGQRLPGIEPFTVIETAGLKVGVVGLTAGKAAPGTRVTDAAAALTEALFTLRSGGANTFVVLSQLGLEADRALARAVPGAHCILGAMEGAADPETVGETVIARCAPQAAALGTVRITLSTAEAIP